MEPAVLERAVPVGELKALWVFAYGSLCWRPGFAFATAVAGHVRGFHRRLWQGNTTHRGTADKPGRVATLIEDNAGVVAGVALSFTGEAALPYLSNRECDLGGYMSSFVTFYPENGDPFKVLVYVATPRNPFWLGDARVGDIADQVIACSGPSGHNVEYVLRLANFMHHHFPDRDDAHLFAIESEVHERIARHSLCLATLMGAGDGCVTFVKQQQRRRRRRSVETAQDDAVDRIETFEHTTRMPEKTLRCLNP